MPEGGQKMFEVTDNVPIPLNTNYPLGTLEVGQSFSVSSERQARSLRSAVQKFRSHDPERQFTVRKVVRMENGGVVEWRCWRVK